MSDDKTENSNAKDEPMETESSPDDLKSDSVKCVDTETENKEKDSNLLENVPSENGDHEKEESEDKEVKSSPPGSESGSPTKNGEENGEEKTDVAEKDKSSVDEDISDVKEEEKSEDGQDDPADDAADEQADDAADEQEAEKEKEPKLGLLERPLVLEGGRKREKKKVERFEMSTSTPPEKKFEVTVGKGTKLGDIPIVNHQIEKTKSDDLRSLYQLLFARRGQAYEIKRHLRLFSGWECSKDDAEFKRKHAKLTKQTLPQLKSICMIVDLEKSGTKEHIIERITNFCLTPADSGKKVPQPKKKGKAKNSKKSETKKTVTPKPKAEKKKGKSKAASDSDDDEEEEEKNDADSEESEEEVESEEEAAEEEESEEESPPPKKKPKKEPVKKAATPNNKKTPKKKAETKKTKKKVESSEEDDSSDGDEPLTKQAGPPLNDEIKEVIKKILDTADLEEVTMKTVVKQVYEKYPKYDLTDRKDFIKTTVKQLIS